MELINQVTSLELSKKLKSLNVKQDSLFYHVVGKHLYLGDGLMYLPHIIKENSVTLRDYYSAFTASELLEILPCYTNDAGCLKIQKHDVRDEGITYFVEYGYGGHESQDPILPNALSKTLILLIENKIIEV